MLLQQLTKLRGRYACWEAEQWQRQSNGGRREFVRRHLIKVALPGGVVAGVLAYIGRVDQSTRDFLSIGFVAEIVLMVSFSMLVMIPIALLEWEVQKRRYSRQRNDVGRS
jgi:hypothetical protein